MAVEGISPLHFYIGLVISGLCAGIGSAFGAYLVNKYLVARTDAIVSRLEEKVKVIQDKLKIPKSKGPEKTA